MAGRKIILITGGNTGIGYEAVKAFLRSDTAYLVLMGSGSLDKARDAIEALKKEVPQTASTVEAVELDVASDESITKAFESVKASHERIDALINNAGKSGLVRLGGQRGNHYGAGILIFITSGLSSLSRTSAKFYPRPQPPPARWPKDLGDDNTAYRSTKAALNMLMVNLAFQLQLDGVKTSVSNNLSDLSQSSE